jgi:hypothetical protein
MPEADSSPRIRRPKLLECRDRDGHLVEVGVGVTDDRRVALIGPPGGLALLTPEQRDEYLDTLAEAFREATS